MIVLGGNNLAVSPVLPAASVVASCCAPTTTDAAAASPPAFSNIVSEAATGDSDDDVTPLAHQPIVILPSVIAPKPKAVLATAAVAADTTPTAAPLLADDTEAVPDNNGGGAALCNHYYDYRRDDITAATPGAVVKVPMAAAVHQQQHGDAQQLYVETPLTPIEPSPFAASSAAAVSEAATLHAIGAMDGIDSDMVITSCAAPVVRHVLFVRLLSAVRCGCITNLSPDQVNVPLHPSRETLLRCYVSAARLTLTNNYRPLPPLPNTTTK